MASNEFMQTFRHDMAALCCAGAFVAQPDMWSQFVEWIKGTEPEYQDSEFDDLEHAQQMMHSVLRVDRLSMLSYLFQGTSDTEIENVLKENGDT